MCACAYVFRFFLLSFYGGVPAARSSCSTCSFCLLARGAVTSPLLHNILHHVAAPLASLLNMHKGNRSSSCCACALTSAIPPPSPRCFADWEKERDAAGWLLSRSVAVVTSFAPPHLQPDIIHPFPFSLSLHHSSLHPFVHLFTEGLNTSEIHSYVKNVLSTNTY